MPTKFIETNLDLELEPGKSGNWKWNNATPSTAVWYANAVPIEEGQGTSKDQSVEVTKLWRRFTFNKHTLAKEHEIWFTVKNVGQEKAHFTVYLSIIW